VAELSTLLKNRNAADAIEAAGAGKMKNCPRPGLNTASPETRQS
jgi:hypothetical protein